MHDDTQLPPIFLPPWQARRIWLRPTLSCASCGWVFPDIYSSAGEMWLTCKNKMCRAAWRAVTIHPCMIGATIEALFGEETGQHVLERIRPETKGMSDEDRLGLLINTSGTLEYLQWDVSKHESFRDRQNPRLGIRVMKALGGV